ncbi:hypothetical protein JVU11DRAFT_5115 [Chiua virens]|nr:hypothetical protein JVU11DRAFT_5115 [Chiua virens]
MTYVQKQRKLRSSGAYKVSLHGVKRWELTHLVSMTAMVCVFDTNTGSSFETIHTGVLHGCPENARRRVFVVNKTSEDSCESEVEYPLTPPLSDSSRSHSPERETPPPADLHTITIKHFFRIRKRRNVAVRRQSKSAFRLVVLSGMSH